MAVAVLRKAAELGLTAIAIPEEFGGMEMDLVSTMVVAEQLARDGSYAGWHGAHSGHRHAAACLFGTDAAEGEVSAEAGHGGAGRRLLPDRAAGRIRRAGRATRADLTADGTHYVLNGQKMWITNGGAADLFTVFAKVGGEKFTAFLVERAFGGVTSGAEEKKMGIKGSSTTAVYLDNVHVPVENVLGEIGRGHIIAFNILNIGRLKLGPFAVGGAKNVLAQSLKYAKERKAFGTRSREFGMIQHKLAEMAIRIYAAESMVWRTAGPDRRPRNRSRPSRSSRPSAPSSRSSRPRCWTTWWMKACRFTAATATTRITRWSAPIAIRASTASLKAPTRSTGC